MIFYLKNKYYVSSLNYKLLTPNDFVKKIKELPLIQNQADWEHPASVDFELLQKAIMFFNESFDVVILEGILVFADAEMNLNYDCCFFNTNPCLVNEEIFSGYTKPSRKRRF